MSDFKKSNKDLYNYPLFKGLQRPLEFIGLQGRYIFWAIISIGGAIAGFILGYCLSGFLIGLILLVLIFSTGFSLILLKKRNGLHTKVRDYGFYIYASSRRM